MNKVLSLIIVLQFAVFAQYNDDMNRFMLAQNFEQNGDLDKAKTIYEDLYTRHPENNQFFEALNRTYTGLKNYDASIKLITTRLPKNPGDINLYGMLGSSYYLSGDEKKAFETWDEGLKKNQDNGFSYRTIANYALERRAFDKAIEYLKKGKQILPDPLIFSYDLANLYSITMQYDNAVKEYLDILKKQPEQFSVVQQRILSLAAKPDAIKSIINAFEKADPVDNISINRLLADLYYTAKDYDKGFQLYKKIDNLMKARGVELFNYARILSYDGNYKTASEIYSYIYKEYPSSPVIPSVKLELARALETELKSRPETNSWKSFSFRNNPDPEEVKKILSAYQDIITAFPNSEQSFEAEYRIAVINREYLNADDKAESLLIKLYEKAPISFYSTMAQIELADIYLEKGQLDNSKKIYSSLINSGRIQEKDLNNVKYLLSKIYFYMGDFENARQTATGVITDFKDDNSNDAIGFSLLLNTMMNDSSNLVKFAGAELLAEQKKFSQAKELYKELSANEELIMLAGLAKFRTGEMDIALDNYDSAIRTMSEIGEEKEKNIYSDKALYLLGKIYQYAKKDKNKAIETYEKLLSSYPQSLYLDDAREQINLLKKIS